MSSLCWQNASFGTNKYKNTHACTHKHTQRLLILMFCCCCFRPWDHPFLRASPPLLFIILYWSVYHTASHWFIHQAVSSPTAASHTQECTLYKVRAGLVMMNYARGYSGTVCATNNALLLPIFGNASVSSYGLIQGHVPVESAISHLKN